MGTHRFPAGQDVPDLGTRDQIDALDRRYAGAFDGPAVEELRCRIVERWEERPGVVLGTGVYPALPHGIARLIHSAQALGIGTIHLEDDLDDLANLWPGEVVRAERVSDAEVVMLSIPGGAGWLERLRNHAARGARLFVRLRAPFDAWWQEQCEGATVEYFRHDCEPYLLPGPMALEGGGDHWLVSGLPGVDPKNLPRHSYRDFDGLDPARCNEEHLRILMARVSGRLGMDSRLSEVLVTGETLSATQVLEGGHTMNLELKPDDQHLLLTFAPYDPRMETTAVSSVYETMGTPHTRTRPWRTARTPTEMIV